MDLRTDSVNDILEHYGVKRRSGRYPFGSGDRPYQHGSPSRGKDGSQYKIKYSVEKAKGNLQSLDRQDVLKRMPKGKLIASTVASTAITDWHDYKGSGSSRYYLSHGIFPTSLERK